MTAKPRLIQSRAALIGPINGVELTRPRACYATATASTWFRDSLSWPRGVDETLGEGYTCSAVAGKPEYGPASLRLASDHPHPPLATGRECCAGF